ncbi:MAG: glycosyltransferase family 2 protein [Bacteroidetes bacterium]|nr:glycosyltransferase family 2 protein [Bacteroidota bacterium]
MSLFFSVIIPTYNRAHLLKKTIDTVLDQSYENFELIVVDDGSSDNTEEVVTNIIKEKGNKVTYVKQKNSERAVARNNGLKKAVGDYVLFFDSDDTLYAYHLETANKYITENNSPEFIHLRYDIKNGDGKIMKEGPIYNSLPNKDMIFGNFLSCNGVFLRKDIALKNQFNEDRELSAMEDWELWLRLCAKYPIHYVNTITSSIIDHEERSVVVTKKDALINRGEAIIKYITANLSVVNYYKKDISKFKSSCHSYIALHLSLTGKFKKETIKYLAYSVYESPATLFHRRFYAIIKHLF